MTDVHADLDRTGGNAGSGLVELFDGICLKGRCSGTLADRHQDAGDKHQRQRIAEADHDDADGTRDDCRNHGLVDAELIHELPGERPHDDHAEGIDGKEQCDVRDRPLIADDGEVGQDHGRTGGEQDREQHEQEEIPGKDAGECDLPRSA